MNRIKALLAPAALALTLLVALIAAPSASAALPPNPNPIDWSFSYSELYYSSAGDANTPIPFRVGQHDLAGYADGFGKVHTQDGHEGVIPDSTHIANALGGNDCQQVRDAQDNLSKYECNQDGVVVVWAPQAASTDPRGCNYECDYVKGIITAYYE